MRFFNDNFKVSKQILIFFLVLFVFPLFAQDIESIKVEYKVDVAASQNKYIPMEYKKEVQAKNDAIRNLTFVLTANAKKTKFKGLDNMPIDSERVMRGAKAAVGGGFVYFNDKDKKIKTGDVFGKRMTIIQNNDQFQDWNITDVSKKILGFNCYKAKTSYKSFDKNEDEMLIEVEAWFSPEIPLSSGPFNYDGLPGVILEFSKNPKYTFKASKIEFNSNNFDLTEPKAKKTIGQKQYEEKVKKVLKDIRERG
ncbi:GLPGLI family protein [Salegentibacter maritimus]|uniref:GLPGLI family protein n=1 Tax=Salegentibacter maritimus TaxID=2794347 RepID=UPI0018E46514|nr:GLPGLI family protein [Salegentibacter maritimus]MBI6116407.1 GLPGLI family protein [Salegentibacter maritimus]